MKTYQLKNNYKNNTKICKLLYKCNMCNCIFRYHHLNKHQESMNHLINLLLNLKKDSSIIYK